eukprot:CAMPEP_0117528050 /NCGR_PEP_ID=MMETSP0784-20121206/37114_1 /TAXON_ID=39447 /ORGANISM="" /LENGTH=205 /DNA_ID=CAMNT_0005324323 /DNA_START=171 /DNA_END=785 /DNA_ORIENTATION=-
MGGECSCSMEQRGNSWVIKDWNHGDMQVLDFPWEGRDGRGRRCPIVLSVKFSSSAQRDEDDLFTHVKTDLGRMMKTYKEDVCFAHGAERVMNKLAPAYTKSGGYVYYPSNYNKDVCKLQQAGQRCYGKCGNGCKPTGDSCWAYSFRWHLEGLTGLRGHSQGIMLQVVERPEGGRSGGLGPGQEEETAMAQELRVPIWRIETDSPR